MKAAPNRVDGQGKFVSTHVASNLKIFIKFVLTILKHNTIARNFLDDSFSGNVNEQKYPFLILPNGNYGIRRFYV